MEYPWMTNDLKTYAEEQEALFRRTAAIWYAHVETLRGEFESGNERDDSLNIRRAASRSSWERSAETQEEIKTGYFTRHSLSNAWREIEAAQELFGQRILRRYERENGRLETFISVLEGVRANEKKLCFAKEVFEWIDRQRNGEAMKARFGRFMSPASLELKKDKAEIKEGVLGWEACDHGSGRMHLWCRAESLTQFLGYFETGEPKTPDSLSDLEFLLGETMEKSDFRKWVETPDCARIRALRFYQNGKFEIWLRSEEDAKSFLSLCEECEELRKKNDGRECGAFGSEESQGASPTRKVRI